MAELQAKICEYERLLEDKRSQVCWLIVCEKCCVLLKFNCTVWIKKVFQFVISLRIILFCFFGFILSIICGFHCAFVYCLFCFCVFSFTLCVLLLQLSEIQFLKTRCLSSNYVFSLLSDNYCVEMLWFFFVLWLTLFFCISSLCFEFVVNYYCFERVLFFAYCVYNAITNWFIDRSVIIDRSGTIDSFIRACYNSSWYCAVGRAIKTWSKWCINAAWTMSQRTHVQTSWHRPRN